MGYGDPGHGMQARQVLCPGGAGVNTTFIAFDFETTGLHPMSAEIIEIGAVKFDAKGKVLGTFEQLIKPAGGIQPEAEAVNGISAAMVANCPSLDEVLPRFLQFIGPPQQNVLVAHNAAKFDIGFQLHLWLGAIVKPK